MKTGLFILLWITFGPAIAVSAAILCVALTVLLVLFVTAIGCKVLEVLG